MKLKPVEGVDIPKRTKNNRYKMELLEQFLKSNEKLMELEFETGEDARATARALYQLCYHYDMPIKVIQRVDRIFLERKD